MDKIRSNIRLYWILAVMHFKADTAYRAAFIIDRIAQMVFYATSFAIIWILLSKFELLGGWAWVELALLLSFQLLAYALGAAFSFTQFRDFEELVRKGTLDVILTKPINTWAYVAFSGFNWAYIGHILVAVGLLFWSVTQLNFELSIWKIGYLIISLISASAVVAAIITVMGVLSVVMVKSSYLYNIFFAFWSLTKYPITIFPVALQWMLLTVVPVAYMNYVPVSVFLDKDVAILGSMGGVLSILSGPLSISAAMLIWRKCMSNYQSAGG